MKNQKAVKFETLKNEEEFFFPNYVKGYDVPYIKISKNLYADLMNKTVLYAEKDLQVLQHLKTEENVKDN